MKNKYKNIVDHTITLLFPLFKKLLSPVGMYGDEMRGGGGDDMHLLFGFRMGNQKPKSSIENDRKIFQFHLNPIFHICLDF